MNETMKRNKRRKFTPEFKARVAMEAARGVRTINEIAADNELHPTQVSAWKKELLDGAASVFEGGGEARRSEEAMDKERAQYERKIGQLTIEMDWLQKKSKELGL